MNTSTSETLYSDYLVGIGTAGLPASERLAAAHRYRALPLAQRWRRWAHWEGRQGNPGQLLSLEQLLHAVLLKPRARSVRKAVQA